MKAAVEHDPLSEKADKGIPGECRLYIPMKRPFGALHIEAKKAQQQLRFKKMCFSFG